MLPSLLRQTRNDSLGIQESSQSEAIYRPLDTERKEIRLLSVQPGSGDEAVVGTLKRVSLRQAINSKIVLRRMRRPDCQRVLWIDAVCINQDDDKERGVQVAMMDMIYSKGFRNLVWLGEAREGDGEALASIRALVKDMRIKTINFRLEPFLATPIGVSTAGLIIKRSISIAEGPIVQFFSRSWFVRLWVLQEAALARYSVCYLGDASIPLRHVLRAALWIRHLFQPTNLGPHPLMMITNSIGRTSAAYEFFLLSPKNTSRFKLMPFPYINLLEITEGFATSEPRDHIFATLGLARQHFKFKETPQLLMPRYDVPVAQVFRDAARFCIHSASDLQVLELLNRHQGTRLIDGLPTWVPDFGEQDDEQRAMYTYVRRSFNADMSRVWRLKDTKDDEPDALIVEGFVVGNVSARSEQHGRGLDTFALLSDPLGSRAGTSMDAVKAREDGALGMVLTATSGPALERQRLQTRISGVPQCSHGSPSESGQKYLRSG
ncbi:hypothetical protein LTR09_008667 [Extremus antarcticus]|uniref:Heterokaryon incompatibility domain-containing protein n=1 Tax=Extremus antarcticus TaxID=702011 RepID=A0AAJ0DAF8_9PEZI|nr:hypothetical protein LTR09_008667 [Extremus antarcticus]